MRHFQPVASSSASTIILDTVEDEACSDPRVWNLVSTEDVVGNTIYGVSYSEIGEVVWSNSYEQALSLFEECKEDRYTYGDYADECRMRLEDCESSSLSEWLREELSWAEDMAAS